MGLEKEVLARRKNEGLPSMALEGKIVGKRRDKKKKGNDSEYPALLFLAYQLIGRKHLRREPRLEDYDDQEKKVALRQQKRTCIFQKYPDAVNWLGAKALTLGLLSVCLMLVSVIFLIKLSFMRECRNPGEQVW